LIKERSGGGGRLSLVELELKDEIEYAKLCINLYGRPQIRSGGEGSRFFALKVDNKICAVAWIHKPHIFKPIFEKFKLDQSNSYFIRRIATCCPGDYAVKLLELLAEKLKDEGKELLVTLVFEDHSGAVFKKAGFTEIGRTPRSGHGVFVKKLK